MEALTIRNQFLGVLSIRDNDTDYILANASAAEVINAYTLNKAKGSKAPTHPTIAHLQTIQQSVGVKIMPENFNELFWKHFIHYLETDHNCKPSTIKNYCNYIVSAFTWAQSYGVRTSKTLRSYHIPEFRHTQVAITASEVALVYYFDIDHAFEWYNDKHTRRTRRDFLATMHRVRDQFVLSCNLGQRYSDISRTTDKNFSDDRTKATYTQKKTTNKAVIDLKNITIDNKITREILERYNYTAPYPGNINNYNEHLHLLLQRIGGVFNEIIVTEYKNCQGQFVRIETPKWKAIASHCGRRTFATYNISRDVSEAKVRRATGHKDSKSFCKYIIWDD